MVKKSAVAGLIVVALIVSFALLARSEGSRKDMPPLPKENGKILYEFLLKEAPELMAQIPCACCDKTLDWCYKGGCPFT
jgi:hypothetical protein